MEGHILVMKFYQNMIEYKNIENVGWWTAVLWKVMNWLGTSEIMWPNCGPRSVYNLLSRVVFPAHRNQCGAWVSLGCLFRSAGMLESILLFFGCPLNDCLTYTCQVRRNKQEYARNKQVKSCWWRKNRWSPRILNGILKGLRVETGGTSLSLNQTGMKPA